MEDQFEILDSDDEPLKDNHDNDNIYVDSEDEALAQALTASRTSTAIEIQDEDKEEGVREDADSRTGWGECPMCTEVILQNLAVLYKKLLSCSGFRSCSCMQWPARVLGSMGGREATWSTLWM